MLRLRSSSNVYGPERGFLEQAVPLRDCGIETELAVLYRRPSGGPLAHPIVSVAPRFGLPVVQVSDTWPLSVGAAVGVAARLRRDGFDILQTHGYKANLIGLLAAALAPRRRVAVLHGLHTANSARLRLYESIDFRVLRRFDLLIAVSEYERTRTLAHGLAPERVVKVHNSIDVRSFAERARQSVDLAELGLPRDAALVAIVGRLDPLKDHATFLAAAAMVARSRPQTHFLIIGEGPLREALENRARELGIAASVHFLGYREDCPALVGRSNLVALSSVAEPFGYVLIEAMAAGRPVVATRAGGAVEIVDDERTGLLVPPGEPAALAAGVLRVLSNRELATAWGEAGRLRAERLFDVHAATPRLAALYRAVAAGATPPPA